MDSITKLSQQLEQMRTRTGFELTDKQLNGSEGCTVIKQGDLSPYFEIPKNNFKVPGSLVMVAKLVEKTWPPTLSFSIVEK